MLYRRWYDFDCRPTIVSNAFWAFDVSCKTGWGQNALSGVAIIGGPKNRIIVTVQIAARAIMYGLFLWRE
jgi:hypothetical protein